jgi:hypothetical protein
VKFPAISASFPQTIRFEVRLNCREAALTAASLPVKISPSESWAGGVAGLVGGLLTERLPDFKRFFARFNRRALKQKT